MESGAFTGEPERRMLDDPSATSHRIRRSPHHRAPSATSRFLVADMAYADRRGLGNMAGNGMDPYSRLAALDLGLVRCSRLAVRPWGEQRKLLATVVPHRVIQCYALAS